MKGAAFVAIGSVLLMFGYHGGYPDAAFLGAFLIGAGWMRS